MPIQDFRCKQCGTVFTRLLPQGSLAVSCPQCQGTPVRALGSITLSAPRRFRLLDLIQRFRRY